MNIFNSLNKFPFWGACLVVLANTSCEREEYESLWNSTTGAYATYDELSAGASTIFSTTKYSYDTNADWVTGDLYSRFVSGDQLYDSNRIFDMDDFGLGGLGPLYVGYSCSSCHNNTGATASTLWTENGSGSSGFSSFLCFITHKDGSYIRNYGRVLHDQVSIYGVGVEPEGKLSVEWSYQTYTFPDGEEYELATPKYTITDWYAEGYDPEDIVITVRTPLRHVGMGQMMSLDETTMIKLAAQSNYPEYGISGKLNYIYERGATRMGISGRKAQHQDLTIELGFSSDMGTTNDRYPEEVSQNQEQYNQIYPKGNHGIQISTEEMEDVDLYLHSVGVPARRNVTDETVMRGAQLFEDVKCALCHLPMLTTKSDRTVLINGTELPWLSSQVIHPYSDYLLHDMGEELCDDYPSGLATAYEWRTTPLWGIGLQQKVNGHTYMMHDGRARNFIEAIMWHDGEGAVSRELFSRLSKDDRDAIVQFLWSL